MTATPPAGLRRFRERPAPAVLEETCELCGSPLAGRHGHVVDLDTRALLCACRPCSLLFTRVGSGGGRFLAVPQRYRYDADFALTAAQWESLAIPVQTAFFFRNSRLGSHAAFYPSPAGATESLLPLATWAEVLAANPAMADVADDVEALLVRRDDDRFECFLVPVDACYALVGLVRLRWSGFDGGAELWTELGEFFATLRERGGIVQRSASP